VLAAVKVSMAASLTSPASKKQSCPDPLGGVMIEEEPAAPGLRGYVRLPNFLIVSAEAPG
jgi:hypothetical protein